MTNTQDLTQHALAQLKAGKNIMCAFRSKTQMLHALEVLKGYRALALHSKSDDAEVLKFRDINDHLDDIVLLGFTSKVTVGADIQKPFDNVYLFADTFGGCSARDMKQMMGRARNVVDPVVHVAFPSKDQ